VRARPRRAAHERAARDRAAEEATAERERLQRLSERHMGELEEKLAAARKELEDERNAEAAADAARAEERRRAAELVIARRETEAREELQQLLPTSDPNADKATVLNGAIDLIKQLQTENDHLMAKKHALESANQELQEENERLSRGAALPPKKQPLVQDSALPAS